MRRLLALVVASAALSLPPSAAHAQNPPKMGPYLGIALDLVDESFDDYSGDPDFDPGVGFLLTAGYRFHPNIAFEGTVSFIDHIDSDDSDDFDATLNITVLSFNGNLKGYLTTLRFQPYVLIGMGVTRFQFDQDGDKDKDAGVSAQFGGGFDWYVTPRISLGFSGAYVVTTGKIEDLDHSTFGLGAQYRF
ncbi:MAG: porin family protein [Myxococcota bacterium]|jgi:opacity protein-like surface antigen|nr:porin family protein [Myxococcota bacterium]